MVQPFRIDVPEATLARIRDRVAAYDFDGLPDAGGWHHGTDIAFMRDLAAYWLGDYDWRAVEARLNRLPHFTADIDGYTIHFIHVRGSAPQPRPLLISHGWPGSFLEFEAMIEPLAHPENFGGRAEDGFDLVIPSLPGYGFSSRPAQPVNPRAVAGLFNRLMTGVLGYGRYIAQGGDWGSAVTSWIGFDHASACAGVHLNMVPFRGKAVSEEDIAREAAAKQTFMLEGAYFQLQSTKPQTLAFAMMDSPVGVAAWILEKFATWSDLPRDAAGAPDLSARYSREQLLTNVMLYLVTGSFATATWMYRGTALQWPRLPPDGARVEVPVGVAAFPDPTFPPPSRAMASQRYNITRWTDMPRGGHFGAMEEPGLMADDIRAFGATIF